MPITLKDIGVHLFDRVIKIILKGVQQQIFYFYWYRRSEFTGSENIDVQQTLNSTFESMLLIWIMNNHLL